MKSHTNQPNITWLNSHFTEFIKDCKSLKEAQAKWAARDNQDELEKKLGRVALKRALRRTRKRKRKKKGEWSPLSAYLHFCASERPKIKSSMSPQDVIRELGRRWQTAKSEGSIEKYVNAAEADKKRAQEIATKKIPPVKSQRLKLLDEIDKLSKKREGNKWVQFTKDELEKSDINGLKKIRNTLSKCISKMKSNDEIHIEATQELTCNHQHCVDGQTQCCDMDDDSSLSLEIPVGKKYSQMFADTLAVTLQAIKNGDFDDDAPDEDQIVEFFYDHKNYNHDEDSEYTENYFNWAEPRVNEAYKFYEAENEG